jgi:thioredoxin-related protein
MLPIVHGLEDRYFDQMNFVYLDLDDPKTEELKNTLRYRSRPHFVLLDAEGNIIGNWVGPVSEQTFVEAFEKALQ